MFMESPGLYIFSHFGYFFGIHVHTRICWTIFRSLSSLGFAFVCATGPQSSLSGQLHWRSLTFFGCLLEKEILNSKGCLKYIYFHYNLLPVFMQACWNGICSKEYICRKIQAHIYFFLKSIFIVTSSWTLGSLGRNKHGFTSFLLIIWLMDSV